MGIIRLTDILAITVAVDKLDVAEGATEEVNAAAGVSRFAVEATSVPVALSQAAKRIKVSNQQIIIRIITSF